MTDMQNAAPCYVLGIETQIGLSLIRELGEAGIPVIGIATDANAIGLQSRYLAHGEILRKPRTDEGLAELRSFGERHGRGYLLTVSEANTSWLIDNREHLGLITPLLPSKDAFALVLDKARTLEAAEAVGIDVPRSAAKSDEEGRALLAAFNFPFRK